MREAVITTFLIWLVVGEIIAIYSIAKMEGLDNRRFLSISSAFILCAPIIFAVEMVSGLIAWPFKAIYDTRKALEKSEYRNKIRQAVERQTKQL